MKIMLTIATLLLVGSPLLAQNPQETAAYCAYVQQQSRAQALIQESPSIVSGITPAQGIQPQLILGVTDSVNNVRKGRQLDRIGAKNCELYRDTVTVQTRITYDLPRLEQSALLNRMALLDSAIADIDQLEAKNQKYLDAQNLPRQSVYLLDRQKLQLEVEVQTTAANVAGVVIPALSTEPLQKLAEAQFQSGWNVQDAQNHLARLSDWDVSLSAGAEKPLTPFTGPSSPYAGFTATYNLGSRRADKHLDASAAAYGTWKQNQLTDVVQSVRIIHDTVNQTIAAQQASLQTLMAQQAVIDTALNGIKDSDTTTALTFRNQLLADQIALRVQIQDTEFRIDALKVYLRENF